MWSGNRVVENLNQTKCLAIPGGKKHQKTMISQSHDIFWVILEISNKYRLSLELNSPNNFNQDMFTNLAISWCPTQGKWAILAQLQNLPNYIYIYVCVLSYTHRVIYIYIYIWWCPALMFVGSKTPSNYRYISYMSA